MDVDFHPDPDGELDHMTTTELLAALDDAEYALEQAHSRAAAAHVMTAIRYIERKIEDRAP